MPHLFFPTDSNEPSLEPLPTNDHFTEYESVKLNSAASNSDENIKSLQDDLSEVSTQVGEDELAQIWQWNGIVPRRIDRCMHDIIVEEMRRNPDHLAVLSWDGEFTYGELDRISAQLAVRLFKLGVGVGKIVPLCFEKSMWTVVGVLAVMKAGAAFVLTDPAQPEARLRTIATEVDAHLVLTSQKQAGLGSRIAPTAQVIVVGPELLNTAGEVLHSSLPHVPASAILYVIFTSGSTGKPKGVVISHSNYTSGALPRAEAVGYKQNSRVLDFASYAFDVSIDCMLCTLSQGGCICVPSDETRVNDLSGAIRSMKVNMAHMTPSVARVLAGDVMPILDVLGLGGESVSSGDAAAWGKKTKVIIAYGPSECTVGCTINNEISAEKSYTSIGKAVGGCTWVVDPEDHEILTPIGEVGELLVEGPVVGVGYINEPGKTAVVFIEDPAWLLAGGGNTLGRHGRLYKTGDLVKYDPDGSGDIIFVGRKDRQVKLRGQRVELAEIEHHLQKRLPADASVAAEVITPGSKDREPTLVAFIAELGEKQPGTDGSITSFSPALRKSLTDMDGALSAELPIYMVPTAYVPLHELPQLVSCKVDRKRLQEIGLSISPQQLAKFRIETVEKHEPKTEMDRKMLKLWTQIFGKDLEIGVNDNFFALGGDSLKAMRLVAAARGEGLSLTVANIFTHPTLSAMALTAVDISAEVKIEIPPFSLLEANWNAEVARTEAAKLCNLDASSVEDLYPCTPLQEGLLALSAKISEAYIAQRVVDLADLATAERLKVAFETIAVDCPILRTRIVQLPGHGLMQVIVKDALAWFEGDSLEEYLLRDRDFGMELGEPLARFAVVADEKTGKVQLVLTIHHALYDGWSMPLVIERVNQAYRGLETEGRTPFKSFIKYLKATDRTSSETYWREKLYGATGRQFPSLTLPRYQAQTDSLLEHYVPLTKSLTSSATTLATAIRGGWAIVAATYTASDDVVFGETLTGRNAPVPGIEQIEGPLITTVPVRIRVNRTTRISDYLQNIHNQTLTRISHEHMGLQHIRRLSPDAREACELKTGMVLHPNVEQDGKIVISKDEPANGLVPAGDEEAAREALKFSSYPLMLVCSLGPQGFLIMASFDSNIIEVFQMERMLEEFGRTVQQLCQYTTGCIGDIQLLSEDNVVELWKFSSSAVHSLSQNDKKLGGEFTGATATWIVDLVDSERLLPVGAIGELLIESPDELSLPSIDSPRWLVAGCTGFPGRQTSHYKTNHMAKYNTDGSIVFIGQNADSAKPPAEAEKKEDLEVQPQAPTLRQQELLRLWSRVLGTSEEEIGINDSFFELGGDSIGAMKLVSEARMEGLELTVAQVFRHRCLVDMAGVLKKEDAKPSQAIVKAAAAFSALEMPHPNAFLAAVIYPALADPTWKIMDILPARPLQEIAVRGTVQLPRFSARYELIYLDAGIDRARLSKSCQDLISRNEILRTVFVNHAGTCYSVVLEDLRVHMFEYEIEGDLESFSQKLCDLDVQTKMPLGSAFVKFMFVQGTGGRSCLIFRISHAQYDEICLPPLLRQLSALYEGRAVPASIPFSSFVYHVIRENIPKSINYWRQLLRGSSMTVLRPEGSFISWRPTSIIKEFDISSRSREITIATLPTAAWALCLARHLNLRDVTFGEVVSGRNIDLDNCDTVIGPCWQYVPMRVKFQQGWTARDLLGFVQQRHVDSTGFEGIGFKEIVEKCTDWEGLEWFDSVVHQDVVHVEGLGFEGVEGRLETVYPHWEPLREWKFQAFLNGDKMTIEIVTFEPWLEFAEELLGDLGEVMELLVNKPKLVLFE